MKDMMTHLAKGKIFTKLDLREVYVSPWAAIRADGSSVLTPAP